MLVRYIRMYESHANHQWIRMAKYGVHTYVLALEPYLHTSTCLQTGRQTHKSQSAWCSFVYCFCSAYYFSPNNNSQSLCQNGLLYTPYISVHIYCMYVFTQPVLSWTTLQYANKGLHVILHTSYVRTQRTK